MHAVAGSGLRGPGRAHRARTDPTLRPIPAGARRPGGGGGDRAAQSDPRLREPRWAPGRPGGEGAAPRAGLGSLRLRPGGGGLEGGAEPRGRGCRAGGGGARGGGRDPPAGATSVPCAQRPHGRASRRPAPGWADIRAPRSRPPRQRPQIGGAAAPRVTAGPRPLRSLLFLLPSAAPRDASAAPGPLRGGRLPPRFAEGGRSRPREAGAPGAGGGRCPRPGRRPATSARPRRPPLAAASRLLPRRARAQAQAKSLPGAAGRLRRQTATLRPAPPLRARGRKRPPGLRRTEREQRGI